LTATTTTTTTTTGGVADSHTGLDHNHGGGEDLGNGT
jgi:hypothetical protein